MAFKKYKSFIAYYSDYKLTLIGGIFFVIVAAATGRYAPQQIQKLIDEIVLNLKNGYTSDDILHPLVIQFLITYLGLTLVSAFFTFLMRQTIVVTSRKIEYRLKNDLYHHIQKLEIEAFKKYNVGDYMSRLSEDIGKIRELFGPALMYLVNLVTMLFISLYLMYQISPKLTFWSVLPLPFLSIFIFVFNQYSYKFNLKLQEQLSDLTSFAQESYNGIRIIKSFTMESQIMRKFHDQSLNYKNQNLKIVLIDSFFMPITAFLMSLSMIITIYLGGQMYLTNPAQLSLGQLTFMIMTITNLTFPIMAIGWVASLYQRGKAAMDRYHEIMSLPEEKMPVSDLENPWQLGAIRFKNLSYTYPDTGIRAINNLNLEIPLGQRWLIVGKTGSGKSTLAEILMKFYANYEGDIYIGNKNLKEVPTAELRKSISYIPQDVFLFSDEVSKNIAFAEGFTDDLQITKAAKDAQIHDEILKFERGYQTVVGERGITLSGGQKQRISIARALIKPSPIYLFDDCLSAVDVETEKRLIDAINQHEQVNTMIMITHRIFNQLKFDQIVVLADGGILEMGSHEELIKKGEYYAELYKKQELSSVGERIS